MICNNNYFADIHRVCEIKDLIWVMSFQSPKVYFCVFIFFLNDFIPCFLAKINICFSENLSSGSFINALKRYLINKR